MKTEKRKENQKKNEEQQKRKKKKKKNKEYKCNIKKTGIITKKREKQNMVKK